MSGESDETARLGVEAPGARLVVHAYGEAEAPPVLAVHGFASNARANWVDAGWARALVRDGRRLLALDQRGHGDSDRPHDTAAYDLDTLVDDVAACLDALGLEDVDLLGYSLGSRVLYEFALRHPGRVRTLSLGGVDGGDPFEHYDLAAARRLLADGTPIAHEGTATLMAMAQAVPGNDPEALLALVEGVRSGRPGTPVDAAAPVSAPAVVVTGGADVVTPGGAAFAAGVGAAYVALPGRTHANALTARAFKDAVLENLRR